MRSEKTATNNFISGLREIRFTGNADIRTIQQPFVDIELVSDPPKPVDAIYAREIVIEAKAGMRLWIDPRESESPVVKQAQDTLADVVYGQTRADLREVVKLAYEIRDYELSQKILAALNVAMRSMEP